MRMRWEQNNTLDCNNILTITLVFIKFFSKDKNRNLYFNKTCQCCSKFKCDTKISS